MQKGISTIMTVCLTAVVALAIAAGGYYFINKQNQDDKASLQAQIDDLNTELAAAKKSASATTTASAATTGTSTTTTTTDWKAYTNAKYGYTLTFTDKWLGYKTSQSTEIAQAAASIKYCVPTTDKSWSDTNLGAGYACPFTIHIYNKTVYDGLVASANSGDPFELEYGTKLAENATYVATVSYWQDSPDDLRASGLDKTVTTVAQSLKFTN